MKKVYYILFAAMGLASCSSDETFESSANVNEEVTQELDLSKRSYDEVLEIAQNSISMLQDSTAITRGEATGRTLNLENGVKIYRQKVTRADGSVSNDPLLYVFNFNDDKGFAVVSANRATEGLLAVVENGSYDPNSKWDDSYAVELLENAKEYVANAKSEVVKMPAVTRAVPAQYRPHIDTTYHKQFAPRIKVKWAQKGPAGSLCPNIARACPNNIAGSGPIAVAQIMTFWGIQKNNFPDHIYLGHCGGVLYFDWKKINNWVDSDKKKGMSSDQDYNDMATLVREIGYLAKAKYWNDQTETALSDLRNATVKLGYGATNVEKFDPKKGGFSLASRLWGDNFAIMEASNSRKSGRRHIFILDGLKYVKALEYFQVSYDGGKTWQKCTTMSQYNHETQQHYINWGEAGKYDGFYTTGLFTPTVKDNNGRTTDYFENWKGGSYNTDMQFFINYWNK